MLAFGTAAHGAARRRTVRAMDVEFAKGEWMETGSDPRLSPTVSLIEQPAHSRLGAHFHRNNQFQFFVGGGGTIGPAQLVPVTIHYAGAYTGYGPLVAGSEGIQYFTMRPLCEAGAFPIATSREHMVRGPKRHATSAPVDVFSHDRLSSLPQVLRSDVIPHAADGLGATILCVPPGDSITVPWASGADGMFLMVLSGTILHSQGSPMGRWETLFASTAAELPPLEAGPDGAQVACAFVPAKADAYLQPNQQEKAP